jgi:hypothetical protein
VTNRSGAVSGVSGTIDRLLGHQPIFGFLKVVNRFLIPRVDALAGYELYANLSVAVFGSASSPRSASRADSPSS